MPLFRPRCALALGVVLDHRLPSIEERKCIHGKLYDLDGEISDEVIRKEILDEIRPYQKTNVAKMVDRILSTLKRSDKAFK